MANMTISNATARPVTISGDKGIPRIKIAASGTATVYMSTLAGNVQFCDELSTYITAGTLTAVVGTTTVTAAQVLAYRDRDMAGATYDVDGDGVVDTSAAGAAHAASDGSSHTFIDQSVVSGASPIFAVTNMTGSAAGIDSDSATHISSDGSDHTFIDQDVTNASSPIFAVTNMTGSAAGIDSDSATHISSDGSDHTFIDQDVTNASSPIFAVTNMTGSAAGLDSDATTHIASAGLDHAYLADNLVQAVITAVGGTGGAAAGTISVQVNDLGGNPITRAVNLRLDISDTDGAGSLDPAATAQFVAATTGTLVIGNGAAAAIVTTDATGLYEGTTTNAADETNYFSASSTDGGGAAAVNTCAVAQCATADATWTP